MEDVSEALRSSAERYRVLFEQAPVGVFFYDRELVITECNEQFVRILQSTRERLIGLELRKLRHLAILPALEDALLGENTHYEGPYIATTSTARLMISMNMAALRDAHGSVVGAMGVVEDVTERVHAVAALRASQQRLAAHVRRTPLGVIVWSPEQLVQEWNEAAARIFGYSAAEAIGRPMSMIVPAVATDGVQAHWRELLGGGGGIRANENETKDGRTILCRWYNTPLLGEDGAVIGVASLVEDITERHNAQEALKQSEGRFRALIELAPEAISVTRDGVFVYVNPELVRYLAYASPSEIVGREFASLVHEDDLPILNKRAPKLHLGHALPAQEYRLLRKDGAIVTAEMVSMMVDYDGAPSVLSIARDVTDRRMMQAKLLQADRMVSVGTLAAGVAHEINNPLAYVMANLDVMARRRIPRMHELARELQSRAVDANKLTELRRTIEQVQEMLQVAREGAERVRSIVRDLKTFSRSDDEKREVIDARRVLDASINMAWNEIRHRAQLVREYGDVPPIEASEARVAQVFVNLLVNAAQALPVGAASKNTITARTWTDGLGRVVIEIADTGPGIPAQLRTRIFDPFFTTKPVGVGTGLGLWICQGIVDSLGGTIGVDTEPGGGAVFRVALPARVPPVSPSGSALPDADARAGRRARILVIDDETPLGLALCTELQEEHEVVNVGSGREALDVLRSDGNFDVILCDLMMPDVTGMDVYTTIAAERPTLAPRFVFMTGGAFTPRAHEFLDHVTNEKLEKPFDMRRIRTIIAGLVRRA